MPRVLLYDAAQAGCPAAHTALPADSLNLLLYDKQRLATGLVWQCLFVWCRGDVDLNRDFPDPLLLGSTGLRPTGDEQPETLALMTWTSQTHFVASASMHEVGSHFMPCVPPQGCCISQHAPVRVPSLYCGRGSGWSDLGLFQLQSTCSHKTVLCTDREHV